MMESMNLFLPVLVNYLLVISVAMNLLLVWLLLRQNVKTPAISIYSYLAFLVALDSSSAIYLLNSSSAPAILLAGNARIILESFILAILHYFATRFTFSRQLPRPDWKNIAVLGMAGLLSLAAFFNLMVKPVNPDAPGSFPGFTFFYWGWNGYFVLVSISILFSLRNRLQLLFENGQFFLRQYILTIMFPLTIFSFFLISVLPFFINRLDFLFTGYIIITVLLFYNALRFHILEVTENNRYLLPQAGVSAFFLLIFYFTVDLNTSTKLWVVLLSIPGVLFTTFLGNYILIYFKNTFQRVQSDYDEFLDKKIEQFSHDIGKVVEVEQLWEMLAKFCKETLQFSNVAIITSQFDISPYQIAYTVGFSEKELQSLLANSNSPLMDKLENAHEVVNRFDWSEQSVLYRDMESFGISVAFPLIKQHELNGMVFLGDQQPNRQVPYRYIHLMKLISSQVAIAMENIRTIQNIVQSQKMAEIGMFASQLAHDFRSFITLVKMSNEGNTKLIKHAAYMEKMVQDLLNYARPQELKLSPVNINQLIDMSLDLIRIPPYIQLEKNYADNLPKIPVDIDQMRRVFTNLLANSIRAMILNEGTRLKITTRTLRPLTKRSSSPWVYIEILDEGLGIPEEFLDRIFDPFFTTHKKDGGNGLGLAIVRQIITRHSGFIDVASKPGKGTVFNIRLPYQMV